jgi:hypothetical protein
VEILSLGSGALRAHPPRFPPQAQSPSYLRFHVARCAGPSWELAQAGFGHSPRPDSQCSAGSVGKDPSGSKRWAASMQPAGHGFAYV